MDTKEKLIAGFKRYREKAIKEKSSGWQFKVRVYNKIMKLIREYDGEITSSESFKGIKGVGWQMTVNWILKHKPLIRTLKLLMIY